MWLAYQLEQASSGKNEWKTKLGHNQYINIDIGWNSVALIAKLNNHDGISWKRLGFFGELKERSRACRALAIKWAFNTFCGVKVKTVRPVQQLCASPDVPGIDDFQVLGQTEVSIQVGWKNPPAKVDYFRLTATDPSGQEEELSVKRSQEARTEHTIVGQLCDTTN